LLNKENPRLSSKHLPFPFQDTNHERMVPTEEDYARMEMLQQHNENLLHMQQQYSSGGAPRMNSSSYNVYPKTVDELRMVASSLDRLNPSLKRAHVGGEPVLKPPSGLVYQGYQLPESIRAQLPSGHSLESLMSSQAHFRESASPSDPNKKIRMDNTGGQTAEVK